MDQPAPTSATHIDRPLSFSPGGALLVLAHHRQLRHLQSLTMGRLVGEWPRAIACELARVSECPPGRLPNSIVRVHSATRVEFCRVLRISRLHVWVSDHPRLEVGSPVVIEHEDPQDDCVIELRAHVVERLSSSWRLTLDGPATIARDSSR